MDLETVIKDEKLRADELKEYIEMLNASGVVNTSESLSVLQRINQIIEWLEELKRYRDKSDSIKVREEE